MEIHGLYMSCLLSQAEYTCWRFGRCFLPSWSSAAEWSSVRDDFARSAPPLAGVSWWVLRHVGQRHGLSWEKGLTDLMPLCHFLSRLLFIRHLLFPSLPCTRCSSGPISPPAFPHSVLQCGEPVIDVLLWIRTLVAHHSGPSRVALPLEAISHYSRGGSRHLHLKGITPALDPLLCLHGLPRGMLSPCTLAAGSESSLSPLKRPKER